MSFNRLDYDINAYRQQLNESLGPGVYTINMPRVDCVGCYPTDPYQRLQVQGGSVSKSMPLVDVDSELMNITRKLSKDPSKKYIPRCPDSMCTSGEVCGQGVAGQCSKHARGQRYGDNDLHNFPDCRRIGTEDTRISNPTCTLRGTGWNRWEWLCINPQERVEMPFDWNINTNIMFRDNHRPCVPTPIDPTPLFPNYPELPCEQINSTCGNFTAPPSVHWQSAAAIRRY